MQPSIDNRPGLEVLENIPIADSREDMTVFDFPVEKRELFIQNENKQPFWRGRKHLIPVKTGHVAIVRTDTDETLGVQKGSYQIRPYKEGLERLNEALYKAGLYGLATIKDEVYEGGAKSRRTMCFDNLKIEPQIGDITCLRIDDWNSYNGQWADQWQMWGMRLWCSNGCTTAEIKFNSSIKHTSDTWNEEYHVERLKRGVEAFLNQEEVFRSWIGRALSDFEAERILKTTLCFKDDKSVEFHERYTKSKFKTLWGLWEREDNNMWGMYNAATNWASHVQKSGGAVHNVERHRHAEVAHMLGHHEWLKLPA